MTEREAMTSRQRGGPDLGDGVRQTPQRRPFYLIGHKCNSVEAVRESVALGANAIECDVRYDPRGDCFVVNHDTTLFRSRDHCEPFLNGVREVAEATGKLALLIFDCKIDDPSCAPRLLDMVRERVTDHVALNVILSVASYDKQRHVLVPLGGRLRSNEGVAIDEDNHPHRVSSFCVEHNLTNHAYANGTFPLGLGPTIPSSTMEAIALSALEGKLDMVYGWTYRSQDSMRNLLRMGIDGIAVDDIARLREVLEEPACRDQLRLGRPDEPLFTRPRPAAYVLEITTGTRWQAGTDANLCFRLEGSKGTLQVELNAAPARLFERSRTDRVTLFGPDIGEPRLVGVSRDSAGRAPDWYLELVRVRSSQLSEAYSCTFAQWIPAGVEVTRELQR